MHILVVDDDQAVRDSLKRSLEYNGYEVCAAEDGVQALVRLAATRKLSMRYLSLRHAAGVPISPGRSVAVPRTYPNAPATATDQ